MASKIIKHSTMNLLEWLHTRGLIDDPNTLGNFIIANYNRDDIPIHLKFMLGFGAFISSICFVGFISLSKLIDYKDKLEVVTWGVIFVISAIAIYKLSINKSPMHRNFFVQLSFSLMFVGKMLFVYGCDRIFKYGWNVTLSLIFINVLTYNIYKISVDRFISVLLVMLSIFYDILFKPYTLNYAEFFFGGLFIFQIIAVAFFVTNVKFRSDYYPVSYALVLSICVEVLFLSFKDKVGNFDNKYQIVEHTTNLVLTLGLLALLRSIFGKFDRSKLEQFVTVFIAISMLGIISSSGILLAIALIIIGYDKYETAFIVLGALLMALFIFLYYYNLNLSLMSKSLVIIGSGIVLLLSSFYIKYRGWNEEGS
ncbi:DUF4401 domain-containing protein [Candidatus Ichthyocystis hellenicum]|uniref:DUF4401 domain-containing protein n=1 Tax=Candidatus Ichthyocystis hellenicum TaxID=1561003 RepID=UPI001584991D|nr:DUF4401 domain-containing protein [Candidatus Ichthyocystis hellenicum]